MTADDRQAKLAAALRANLRRRKTAAPPPAPDESADPPVPVGGERKPQ